MEGSTVSKAFDRLRYILIGIFPLSISIVIRSIFSKTANSVECPRLKPYCPALNISSFSKYEYDCLKITFSNTLEIDGSREIGK